MMVKNILILDDSHIISVCDISMNTDTLLHLLMEKTKVNKNKIR